MLEATELLLRSALKARIPRADLAGFAVEGDDLVVLTPAGALRVSLGAAQAALWLKTLQKPAPSLAAKLGISPQNPAFVIGNLSDAALIAALQGCTLGDAALFVAELPDQAAFEVALAVILPQPQARFWGGGRGKARRGGFPRQICARRCGVPRSSTANPVRSRRCTLPPATLGCADGRSATAQPWLFILNGGRGMGIWWITFHDPEGQP